MRDARGNITRFAEKRQCKYSACSFTSQASHDDGRIDIRTLGSHIMSPLTNAQCQIPDHTVDDRFTPFLVTSLLLRFAFFTDTYRTKHRRVGRSLCPEVRVCRFSRTPHGVGLRPGHRDHEETVRKRCRTQKLLSDVDRPALHGWFQIIVPVA